MNTSDDLFGPQPQKDGQALSATAARGGLSAIVFQATRMGLQLITLAVFSRLLLPEDFGVVVMATTVTAFVGMFSDLGLSAATVQRKVISRDLVSALWLTNIGLGFAVMLACFALAPIAAHAYERPEVTAVVMASALTYPITAAGAQHSALLARQMRWLRVQSIPVFATVISQSIAISLAWLAGIGYWALVIGNILTPVIQCIFLWQSSSWRPSRISEWTGVKNAISFGFYLTGFNFLTYFHRTFDNVLIGSYYGTQSVGFYSRAYSIFILPLSLLSGPVSSAMVPVLSRAAGNHDIWSRLYLGSVVIITAVAAPAALATTIFASQIVTILLGPGWDEAANILALLAPAMFAHPLFASAQWLFISGGKTKAMFWGSVPAIGGFVLAYLLGISHGAEGVAQNYTIASFIVVPLWLAFAAINARLSLTQLLLCIGIPTLLTGLAWGATQYFVAEAYWLLQLGLFLTSYAVLIVAIVASNRKTRKWVQELARGDISLT